MDQSFKALVAEETSAGKFLQSVKEWNINKLPTHEVLVRVVYSSLNYKDALSATGNKGVTKEYPHIPGIDAAGIVEQSQDDRFQQGDRVIVTSYDLGQNTPGGFGQYIHVPGDWIVSLPDALTLYESMALGTAGLTAAMGIHHLQHNNVDPDDGPLLVTGATGGVGTMAISILAKLGYKVTAATGKMDQQDFLQKIGTSAIAHRKEVQDNSSKLLLDSRWAGVVDTVGGQMLDTALRQTAHNGTVTCCGNVLGHKLHTNVYPFILRGVTLAGIDSGNCTMELRQTLWQQLASSWKPNSLNEICRLCPLEALPDEINKTLEGGQVGRVVVALDEQVH